MYQIRFQFRQTALILLLITAFSIFYPSNSFAECSNKQFKNKNEYKIKSLDKVPTYQLFAHSLDYYDAQCGFHFYKKSDFYMPYSATSWKKFQIGDKYHQRLYLVEMKNIIIVKNPDGTSEKIIEMEIEEGPRNLDYPKANEVKKYVDLHETSVVTKSLSRQIGKVISYCTKSCYFQNTLQFPFKLSSIAGRFDDSLRIYGTRIADMSELYVGDIVLFDPNRRNQHISIYTDFGFTALFRGFKTRIKPLPKSREYQVYRVFSGFGSVKHKINEHGFQNKFFSKM